MLKRILVWVLFLGVAATVVAAFGSGTGDVSPPMNTKPDSVRVTEFQAMNRSYGLSGAIAGRDEMALGLRACQLLSQRGVTIQDAASVLEVDYQLDPRTAGLLAHNADSLLCVHPTVRHKADK